MKKPTPEQLAKSKQVREELKAISRCVKPLVLAGEYSCVNDALVAMYIEDEPEITEMRTLHDWKKGGYSVTKGSASYVVWGKPQKYTEKDVDGLDEEEKEKKMFPVCHLFSNLQVEEDKK